MTRLRNNIEAKNLLENILQRFMNTHFMIACLKYLNGFLGNSNTASAWIELT